MYSRCDKAGSLTGINTNRIVDSNALHTPSDVSKGSDKLAHICQVRAFTVCTMYRSRLEFRPKMRPDSAYCLTITRID